MKVVAGGSDVHFPDVSDRLDRYGREVALFLSGLDRLGVKVDYFVNHPRGFVVVLSPDPEPELAEEHDEGLWTPTERGALRIGTVLRSVTELVWRGWEEVSKPALVRAAEEADARDALRAARAGDDDGGDDDPGDQVGDDGEGDDAPDGGGEGREARPG